MRRLAPTLPFFIGIALAAPAAHGQNTPVSGEPTSLFELLDLVERGLEVETIENQRREQAFIRALDDQERLLAEAMRRRLTLRELEELYIDEIMQCTGGNKVRAARILGIDRKTLYRRAERGGHAITEHRSAR